MTAKLSSKALGLTLCVTVQAVLLLLWYDWLCQAMVDRLEEAGHWVTDQVVWLLVQKHQWAGLQGGVGLIASGGSAAGEWVSMPRSRGESDSSAMHCI
jgi:hypothetical protein